MGNEAKAAAPVKAPEKSTTKAEEKPVPKAEEKPVPKAEEKPVSKAEEKAAKAEAKVTGSKEAEEKELTRTTEFQNCLQDNMSKLLEGKIKGEKISRDMAYKLFKESFDTMVEFLVQDKEKRLPLSGVGTFVIRMAPPRTPVMGGVSKLAHLKEIPHLKWRPSDRYRKHLLKVICNFEEPEAPKEKK